MCLHLNAELQRITKRDKKVTYAQKYEKKKKKKQ